MELRRQGAVEEQVFAETRLRRGVYGQRYDNGQRHDGVATQRARVPRRRADQGARDALGRARHACASRSRSAASRPTSSTCSPSWPRSTPTASCTSPRARTSSSTSSTSTTRPTLMRRLAAVGITTREACGNSRPQRHRLPAGRRLPHRGVRRHALRGGALAASCSATPTPGLRPQVQDRLLGLRGRGLRAGDDARPRRHRRARAVVDGSERRAFDIYVGGGLGATPAPGQAALRGRPGGGAAADGPGHRPRLRAASARSRTATARASSSWSPSSASTSSGGWSTRSARRCPTTTAGPRTSPTCRTTSTRRPCASRRGLAQRRRPPRGLRRVGAHQRLPPAPAGLRRRDDRAAAGRHQRPSRRARSPTSRAATWATRVRTTVEQNIVLRWVRRGATCPRSTPSCAAIGLAAPGRRDDRRRHRLPRHRHLQARHRLLARAGRRAAHAPRRATSSSSTRRCAACASRSAAASTPAASTTSPTSASTATAARSTACTVPHFQVVLGGQWRENAGSYGLAIGAVPVEAHPRGRRRASPTRFVAERERERDLPGLHRPPRQEGARAR